MGLHSRMSGLTINTWNLCRNYFAAVPVEKPRLNVTLGKPAEHRLTSSGWYDTTYLFSVRLNISGTSFSYVISVRDTFFSYVKDIVNIIVILCVCFDNRGRPLIHEVSRWFSCNCCLAFRYQVFYYAATRNNADCGWCHSNLFCCPLMFV